MFGFINEAEKLMSVVVEVKSDSVKFVTVSVLDGDYTPTEISFWVSKDDMPRVYLPASFREEFDQLMISRLEKGKEICIRSQVKPDDSVKVIKKNFNGILVPSDVKTNCNKPLRKLIKLGDHKKAYKTLLKAGK